MTPSPYSGPYGGEDAEELMRSVSRASSRLWDEVISRLTKLEQSQSELEETIRSVRSGLAELRGDSQAPASGLHTRTPYERSTDNAEAPTLSDDQPESPFATLAEVFPVPNPWLVEGESQLPTPTPPPPPDFILGSSNVEPSPDSITGESPPPPPPPDFVFVGEDVAPPPLPPPPLGFTSEDVPPPPPPPPDFVSVGEDVALPPPPPGFTTEDVSSPPPDFVSAGEGRQSLLDLANGMGRSAPESTGTEETDSLPPFSDSGWSPVENSLDTSPASDSEGFTPPVPPPPSPSAPPPDFTLGGATFVSTPGQPHTHTEPDGSPPSPETAVTPDFFIRSGHRR